MKVDRFAHYTSPVDSSSPRCRRMFGGKPVSTIDQIPRTISFFSFVPISFRTLFPQKESENIAKVNERGEEYRQDEGSQDPSKMCSPTIIRISKI